MQAKMYMLAGLLRRAWWLPLLVPSLAVAVVRGVCAIVGPVVGAFVVLALAWLAMTLVACAVAALVLFVVATGLAMVVQLIAQQLKSLSACVGAFLRVSWGRLSGGWGVF